MSDTRQVKFRGLAARGIAALLVAGGLTLAPVVIARQQYDASLSPGLRRRMIGWFGDGTAGPLEQIPSKGKYSVAGLDNDREVEEFFLSFKEAVAKGDKAAAASMVSYPIRVTLANGRRVTIRNKAQFVRRYDAIFDKDFKQLILQTRVEDLWAKWSGVATPRGEIWFRGIIGNKKKAGSPELKIIKINGVVDKNR
jgi:hypothetical protein